MSESVELMTPLLVEKSTDQIQLQVTRNQRAETSWEDLRGVNNIINISCSLTIVHYSLCDIVF